MFFSLWRRVAAAGVLFVTPSHDAVAGHHACGCCEPTTICCYEWRLVEVEDTVYEITTKQEKVKVRRPVIKELKLPVTEIVCVPVASTVMEPREVPKYTIESRPVDAVVCKKVQDECGKCITVKECETHEARCLVKEMVNIDVPVLRWSRVAQANTFEQQFLSQDWQEEEITIDVPVKTPKVIRRKIWTKVPVCATCKGCIGGCGK